MNNIKAIILDIDGCIVGEKIGFNSPNPHIDVINKLKNIREKGIPIILCTAKPHFSIREIIKDCKLNNYHITDGGSVLINPINNEIIKKYVIDKDEGQKALKMCLDNNIYTEIYTVDDYIIQRNQISEITKKHIHILQREPKIVDNILKESSNLEITKIMPIALDAEDKTRVENLFKSLNTDLTLSWGIHPVALPLQFGIITAKGISKKQGAIDIIEQLNIKFENTLGIGDSTSDWQFIDMCKYGATLENGNFELKELLKSKGTEFSYIAEKSVDENGIIEILNYFE